MEDIINRARNLGLRSIMFTDHVDFDNPDPLFQDITDYDNYMKILATLQDANKDLEILMGVEVGYQTHLNQRLTKFLSNYPFDFVICSMHCCDGVDFENGDYFKGKSQYEAYDYYFNAVQKSIESYDNYDVYGHLDYIIRYGGFEKKEIKYSDHREILDEILKLLIKREKGIELNTSGFRYNLGVMHPSIDILKQYRELGGEIITIGSDAHKAIDLQADFNDAIRVLKDLGYRAITEFRQRKPKFIDIK